MPNSSGSGNISHLCSIAHTAPSVAPACQPITANGSAINAGVSNSTASETSNIAIKNGCSVLSVVDQSTAPTVGNNNNNTNPSNGSTSVNEMYDQSYTQSMFPDLLGARTLNDVYSINNGANVSSSFHSQRGAVNQTSLNPMHTVPSSQFANLQLNPQLSNTLNSQFNNQLSSNPLNATSSWPLTATSVGISTKNLSTSPSSNLELTANHITSSMPLHNNAVDSIGKLGNGSTIGGLSNSITNPSTNTLLSWYQNPRIDSLPSPADYIG